MRLYNVLGGPGARLCRAERRRGSHSCELELLPPLTFVLLLSVEYVSAHALHSVETHGANRNEAA